MVRVAERLDLATTLAHVAAELGERRSFDAVLSTAVRLATEVIEGCDAASISLRQRAGITPASATDGTARDLDVLQIHAREGPTLDAISSQDAVLSHDLGHELRWPRFLQRASQSPIRSVAALPLCVRGDQIGSLNLYARDPDVFDEATVAVATAYAAHAAVAVKAAKTQAELEAGMATRALIGQAMGIIMATHRISAEDAWSLLRQTSQNRNVRVAQLAEDVLDQQHLRTVNRPG